MASARQDLPDFDDPPVVETVLGVEFAPLDRWGIPHYGLFWHNIRAEYPRFEIQPPLGSQIERLKEEKLIQTVMVELLSSPPVRCWFMDASETRLIQVQNDRFIHNWRKVTGLEPYPHYENIRPRFEQEWTCFREFVDANQIGALEVRQCEVTYVNHLERGKGWQTLADLESVLPSWSSKGSGGFLPAPEAVVLSTRYLLPDNQGRLHIQMQPAIRNRDHKEVLQLTLTARGRPPSPDTADLLQWFDLGREWVVQGFAGFTSTKMHELWRRRKAT